MDEKYRRQSCRVNPAQFHLLTATVLLAYSSVSTLSGCSRDLGKVPSAEHSGYVAKPLVARPVQAFGFVHQETTGVNSFVRLHGKDVPIQFRSDSNVAAVTSLKSLQPEVFLPNANGTTIRLVGQFYEGICRTPDAPDRAESEEYHEFRLDRWYILTPFTEDDYDCPDGRDYCPKTRHSLTKNDFVLMNPTPAELKEL